MNLMSNDYIRLKAGRYSFARFDVERFISDEPTYWLVTNKQNGERVRVDNFKQAKEYITKLETGDSNE